jgi:tetratricopeptide (TPR) repeat protein
VSRLVVDRLWPMLAVLTVLLAGALLLEQVAARRGNETIRVEIVGDGAGLADAGDEEGAAGDGEDGPRTAPLSEQHALARREARRAQHERAIALYEKALQEHPDHPALLGELGSLLLSAGRTERALPLLERADAAAASPQSAYRLGVARGRAEDEAGAEREFRRALSLRPGYGPAQVALGNLLRGQGKIAEAVSLLEAAAQSGSNEERARALVALGAAQLAAGRRADAERAFDRAVEFAPARAEIRLGVARAWLASDEKRDLERAAQVLQRAAEMAPDVPQIHAALGRAREKRGDLPAAAEAYDRALRLDPDYRYARRRMLRLALETRDFARARHDAERLVAGGPEVPEHHFLAALVADREGRDDDARRIYRKAIEVAKGSYPEAYLNLGNLEKNAGDRAAARAAYEKAILLRPRYTAAYVNLARLLEASGHLAGAGATYQKVVQIDPRYAPGWLALGQFRSQLGWTQQAIEDLKQAVAARPRYDAAELSLGVAYRRAGRFDEAVATYRKLLERSPRHVSAWFNLGLSLQASGKLAEARDAFGRAAALDEGHVQSRVALADLDLADGKLVEAKRAFADVVELDPDDQAERNAQVVARAALAEIAALEGDRRGCEERARQLRAEAPQEPRVLALAQRCASAAARPTVRTSKAEAP